jgi:hypothetical protein
MAKVSIKAVINVIVLIVASFYNNIIPQIVLAGKEICRWIKPRARINRPNRGAYNTGMPL